MATYNAYDKIAEIVNPGTAQLTNPRRAQPKVTRLNSQFIDITASPDEQYIYLIADNNMSITLDVTYDDIDDLITVLQFYREQYKNV